jgi:hypothetical protein
MKFEVLMVKIIKTAVSWGIASTSVNICQTAYGSIPEDSHYKFTMKFAKQ